MTHSEVQGGRPSPAQQAGDTDRQWHVVVSGDQDLFRQKNNARQRLKRQEAGLSPCTPAPDGALWAGALAVEYGVSRMSVSRWAQDVGVALHSYLGPQGALYYRLAYLYEADVQTYRAWHAARPPRVRQESGSSSCTLVPDGAMSLGALAAEGGVSSVSVWRWVQDAGRVLHSHRGTQGALCRRRAYLYEADVQTYRAWRVAQPPVRSGPRSALADGERSVRVAAVELGTTGELLSKWLKVHPQWQVPSVVEGAGWNVTDAVMDGYRQRKGLPCAVLLQSSPVLATVWVTVRTLAQEAGRHVTVVVVWFRRRGVVVVPGPGPAGGGTGLLSVALEAAEAYRSWASVRPVKAGVAARRGRKRVPGAYEVLPEVPEGWLSLPEAAAFCGCSIEVFGKPAVRARYGCTPVSTPRGLRYDPGTLLGLRDAHAGRRPPEGWVGTAALTAAVYVQGNRKVRTNL